MIVKKSADVYCLLPQNKFQVLKTVAKKIAETVSVKNFLAINFFL